MNKEWSQLNKTMQTLLRKGATYQEGIEALTALRNTLMDVLVSLRENTARQEFDAMPYINAKGFHNKNIAYSIWHIFRIEDIVAHTLIAGDTQVFFSGTYQERIGAPLITTGNELIKQEIADFTKLLDIDELYHYAAQVKASTEALLRSIPYSEMTRSIPNENKEKLQSLKVISTEESAAWLIDYWCSKDLRGLIQMPFSRHWLMHTEAILRIRDKIDSSK